jgi:hypothetical protein
MENETPQTDELSEQMKEYILFGSLLYAQNEKGEKVWLKRITGNENHEVKPVSVINGQIVL